MFLFKILKKDFISKDLFGQFFKKLFMKNRGWALSKRIDENWEIANNLLAEVGEDVVKPWVFGLLVENESFFLALVEESQEYKNWIVPICIPRTILCDERFQRFWERYHDKYSQELIKELQSRFIYEMYK